MRLAPFQYIFEPIIEQRIGGHFGTTLSICAPNQCHEVHTHENPGIVISLGGDYSEEYGQQTFGLPYLVTRWRSGGLKHSHRVGPAGSLALHVEFDNQWLLDEGLDLKALDQWSVRNSLESQIGALRLFLNVVSESPRHDLTHDATLEILDGFRNASTAKGTCPRWVLHARNMIHDRADENLGLRQIAKEVGISPMHLAAEFRARFGMPISSYQRCLRLKKATHNILWDNQRLGTAAVDAGFCDQAHFCKVFRTVLGSQPRVLATLRSKVNRAFVQG